MKTKDKPSRSVKSTAAAISAKAASEKPVKPAPRATAAAKAKRAPVASPPSGNRIATIFQRFAAANPEPKGELEHTNPFTLLVAVVLSAQATDAGVNKATRPLFEVADTPDKMLALGEDTVREYVKTIGLFRNKAKNVIALSRKLIDEYGGKVPADRDELVKLPGVGRKTANVVLNMAFGQKTMAVDTHVFRVSHRLDLSHGKTPDAVEDDLMKIIPDAFLFHAHHWLILHGRYTCLARKPRCGLCPVAELCHSEDKSIET